VAEAEDEIPSAFLRAFAPTPIERVANFVQIALSWMHGWFHSQTEQVWLPRTVDPVAELKHVHLGEYGLIPAELSGSSRRHGRDSQPTWRF